mgnify:FL=1
MEEVSFKREGNSLILSIGGEEAGSILVKKEKGTLVIEKTLIKDNYRGKGLASLRRKEILSYARKEGLGVSAECSYAKTYLEKHPS